MNNVKMKQEAELELLRSVVANTPDQIYIVYASGEVIDVYLGNERLFNAGYDRMKGKNYGEFFSARVCGITQSIIGKALETGEPQFVTYSIKPSEIYIEGNDHPDDVFWFEARVIPLFLPSFPEPLIMWNARDITEKVKLGKEIKILVDHDELTGTYNRRFFMSYLGACYSRFKRYKDQTSLLMLDIDNFKECNDTYGHGAGDRVIQKVAENCAGKLRESDIFGRIGGEEFAAILPHTDLESASVLAERLRKAVESEECLVSDEDSIRVTISIGISQFLESDSKEVTLLSRADKAMYASKRNGKNRVTLFET